MSAVKPRDGSEFQEFDTFSVEYRDASHRYWLIEHVTGERSSVPSVSGIVRVVPKELIPWAEKMGVEGALRLERAGRLKGVPVEDACKAMREQGEGEKAEKDRSAERGNAIHEALRAYCAEGTVPRLDDYMPDHRPYIEGLSKYLLAEMPEPVKVEQMVADPVQGYAGRFDLLARVDGETVLRDLKTRTTSGKDTKRWKIRPYIGEHLQLEGYCQAIQFCFGYRPASSAIVVVTDEGEFHVCPGVATPEDWQATLDCHSMLQRLTARAAAT